MLVLLLRVCTYWRLFLVESLKLIDLLKGMADTSATVGLQTQDQVFLAVVGIPLLCLAAAVLYQVFRKPPEEVRRLPTPTQAIACDRCTTA